LPASYAGPDRAVLAPAHAYPFFRSAAQMAEARFDTAPEDGFTVSVDALLDAVRPDTGIVFLANPGNPTGTRIPASEIRRLRDALRADILLVIDEAYGEFADPLDERLFDWWSAATPSSCAPSPRPMASLACVSAGGVSHPPSPQSFARS
jgi:histidinol-phosphate aminotransferase